MNIERTNSRISLNIIRAYYCAPIITLIVCSMLWQMSSEAFPTVFASLTLASASLIFINFCISYILSQKKRDPITIQTPEKHAPLFPIAPLLIPKVNSYCTIFDLAKLARVNHEGRSYFHNALKERAAFFGCTDPTQSKIYYQAICQEIIQLCKGKLIPQDLISHKPKKIFKNREINTEATLFNLKFLTSDQIFKICSSQIPHHHVSKYLNKLTAQNILRHDGIRRPINLVSIADNNQIELLINHGGNLNNPALMEWAAQHGNTDLIRRNLANGGDIRNGRLLECAILGGHIETIRFLLESGLDGRNLIELAVREAVRQQRDDQILTLLLNQNNPQSFNFGSALPFAVTYGRFDLVRSLILHGANPNALDHFGNSALCYASQLGHIEMVTFLLDYGALSGLIGQGGRTPLMFAMTNRNTFWTIADLLLSRGANIQATDEMGNALIHHAINSGWWQAIEGLVQRGANPIQPGFLGSLPLHFALSHSTQKINLVTELLKYPETDVNVPNANGLSPLCLAATTGNVSIIQNLLQKGANVNYQGAPNGYTPLFYAILCLSYTSSQNRFTIIRTLLEHGANPNLRNAHNQTVLVFAKSYEYFHPGLVSLLRSYRAV